MNNTIAKLPDIWYDFYGRLLPGAYGVSFFQLFVLGQSIEATLENFLYIMISGYLLGHIFQPISSMIILWRERKHDPDDQKGQVNSEMGPETRAAHLLSKVNCTGFNGHTKHQSACRGSRNGELFYFYTYYWACANFED